MARGPAYPYINLQDAIGYAKSMYDYAKRGAANTDAVVSQAWKASPTSSSSVKIVAALKYFGLIEDAPAVPGKPDAKPIRITERAYRIILDAEDSPERKRLIREAALMPKWYQFCWNKWGADMPPAMRASLIFDNQFVESTVDAFLKGYKQTIEFSGLLTDQGQGGGDETVPESEKNSTPAAKIGDYIQWESAGVLQFSEPRRVISLSDDGQYAFVEGARAGLPVSELTVCEKPRSAPADLPASGTVRRTDLPADPPPIAEKPHMRHEVFSMTEGNLKIEWPAVLSPESFEDFKDWLKILERKVGRSVEAPKRVNAPQPTSSDLPYEETPEGNDGP